MSRFICTLAMAILLSVTALAQQPVYRFKADQPYKFMIEGKTDIITEAQSQTETVSVESTAGFFFTQDKVLEDGTMHITVKVENALLLIESSQGSQSIGDDLAGTTFGFTMKPDGDVVKPDSSIKQFDGKSIQVLVQAIKLFPTLDPANLTAGNSWQVSEVDTTDTGDNIIIRSKSTKYTVNGTKAVKNPKTGKERQCLEISFTRETETNGSISQQGMDFTMSGTDTETGIINYDPAEGMLVDITSSSNGELHVTDASGSSTMFDRTTSGTEKIEWITE